MHMQASKPGTWEPTATPRRRASESRLDWVIDWLITLSRLKILACCIGRTIVIAAKDLKLEREKKNQEQNDDGARTDQGAWRRCFILWELRNTSTYGWYSTIGINDSQYGWEGACSSQAQTRTRTTCLDAAFEEQDLLREESSSNDPMPLMQGNLWSCHEEMPCLF